MQVLCEIVISEILIKPRPYVISPQTTSQIVCKKKTFSWSVRLMPFVDDVVFSPTLCITSGNDVTLTISDYLTSHHIAIINITIIWFLFLFFCFVYYLYLGIIIRFWNWRIDPSLCLRCHFGKACQDICVPNLQDFLTIAFYSF